MPSSIDIICERHSLYTIGEALVVTSVHHTRLAARLCRGYTVNTYGRPGV